MPFFHGLCSCADQLSQWFKLNLVSKQHFLSHNASLLCLSITRLTSCNVLLVKGHFSFMNKEFNKQAGKSLKCCEHLHLFTSC